MPLRIVELDLELELAAQVFLRDRVDGIDRGGCLELAERRARSRRRAVHALGRVVAVPVVVLGASDVGRERGELFGERVDPRVSDRVDRRGSAGCICHDIEPRQGPGRGQHRQWAASFQSVTAADLHVERHREVCRVAHPLRGRCAPRHPTPPARPRSTSSSWICMSTRERSCSAAKSSWMWNSAIFMMSAALPWIGALSAARSAFSRSTRFGLARSGNGRRRPKIVSV